MVRWVTPRNDRGVSFACVPEFPEFIYHNIDYQQ